MYRTIKIFVITLFFITTNNVIAESVKKAKIIAYEDLGAEAIREMEVENFPCIVANDVLGNDIFDEGVKQYKR